MTPHAVTETSANPLSDCCEGVVGGCFAPAGIIGALLDALNDAEGYCLFERDGEFFLEPVCCN
jgi:hypothetical protein